MGFFNISNRRYLGSKTRLLKFIEKVIKNECKNAASFADLFAGTGVVSNMLCHKYNMVVNDILLSNYHSYITWFDNRRASKKRIQIILDEVNEKIKINDNYFSNNFSNTYFTRHNALKIGYMRDLIERYSYDKFINKREESILLTSLIYAADKVANTCGHYDAYRMKMDSKKKIEFLMPEFSTTRAKNIEIYNEDANVLVKKIKTDIVYIDPPYNSRQYSDTYHLLENLVEWKKPKVYGIAKKIKDRSHIKSLYCTKEAKNIFMDLIKNIKTKYIVVSFNNMEKRGDGRSHSKISSDEIIEILSRRGRVKVFKEDFKQFTTGKTMKEEHKEMLYVCKTK